jgi:hypothetical protein
MQVVVVVLLDWCRLVGMITQKGVLRWCCTAAVQQCLAKTCGRSGAFAGGGTCMWPGAERLSLGQQAILGQGAGDSCGNHDQVATRACCAPPDCTAVLVHWKPGVYLLGSSGASTTRQLCRTACVG